MTRFSTLVEKFIRYLLRLLRLSSEKALLELVVKKKFAAQNAEERKVLDAYNHRCSLPPLESRNPASPMRISTLLHWRTLHHLLCLGEGKKTKKSTKKKIQKQRATVVKEPNEKLAVQVTSSNGRCIVSATRSGHQRGRRVSEEEPSGQQRRRKVSEEPSRQNSSRSNSSRHGSSKRHPRSEEHQRPKVSSSNSSRSSVSSSYTNRDDYIDSHCHLDCLYNGRRF